MKQNIYLPLLFLLLSLLPATAQQVGPVRYNAALQQYHSQQPAQKMAPGAPQRRGRDCNLEETGVLYLSAGDSIALALEIDTFGLDTLPGEISCANCTGNPIGEAYIDDLDQLVLLADDELQGARYTFKAQFCNPNGCRNKFFKVVGRRENRLVQWDTILLEAEELYELSLPASDLPGPLACNKITDFPDEYDGLDQLSFYTTYTKPDSNIIYAASRHAGVDVITATLCDSFAVCDDYRIPFRIQHDTLKVGGSGGLEAYLDDFSSYRGPVASTKFWLDKSVYVNDHYATDVPSIGMATFDGLNALGRPYGDSGAGDRLTSTYIDLRGFNNSEEVFLTFWLKPAGLGDWPEPTDIIALEYRKLDGQWETIFEYRRDDIRPDTASTADFFHTAPIPNSYRYKAFQFRFQAINEGFGATDIWNLDYVWLGAGQAVKEADILDIAINQPPGSLIRDYTAMPWRHFRGQENELVAQDYAIGLFNQDNGQDLNAGAGDLIVRERNTGQTLLNNILLNACCRTVFQDSLVRYIQPLQGRNSLVSAMASGDFDGEEKLAFELQYRLSDVTNEQAGDGYEAVQTNNEVNRTTVFDDYFAYDDGSAERLLWLYKDAAMVSRFTATVEDTLQGVQFYFPISHSQFLNQRFDIVVWVGELDGEPDFRMEDVSPFYLNLVSDSLQGFISYPLIDEFGEPATVLIPPGDFYVGWEQVSPCNAFECTSVGLDRNGSDGRSRLYYRFKDDPWTTLDSLSGIPPGEMMIRPVVGSEPPLPTPAEDIITTPGLTVYPNPVRGQLHLEFPALQPQRWRMALFNTLGQAVYEGVLRKSLPVHGFANGVYWLKVYRPGSTETHQRKLIIAN
jgi:hypothetical protein